MRSRSCEGIRGGLDFCILENREVKNGIGSEQADGGGAYVAG